MLPIIATIPQLPQIAFLALVTLALATGLLLSLRTRAQLRHADAAGAAEAEEPAAFTPLMLAAFACAMLWVWSRNPIKLHSYGLFLILGFAAAVWSACLEAKRRGRDPNIIVDLALPLLAASIVMCRIVYIALDPGQFDSLREMVSVWDGGLSFHGSLIAAPLVIWYYAHRNGMSFGELADIIAPSVFLGYGIARLGCFFNGCCYGAVCELPWAMRFRDEHHPGELTPPSHPTQLYSSLLGIGLFALMQRAKVSPRFNRFAGQLTLLFFALYAVERAVVEIFRNGTTASTVLGTDWLTQAQFVSFVGLAVIAVLWAVLARRAAHSNRHSLSAPH